MTDNFKAFLILLLFGIGLTAAVAFAADPDVPQIGIILTYQDGQLVGGDVVGTSGNTQECQRGLQQVMSTLQPKAGVMLAAICTPLPPAPAVAKHKGEASI
jgi:hypothetical protein